MPERFRKFKESLQPAVKLAIAAENCFLEDTTGEAFSAYSAYLRQRLRPAAELFAEQEDTEGLDRLWQLEPFPRSLVEDLLRQAAAKRKNAVYAWALKRKQENWGFSPRNFSL